MPIIAEHQGDVLFLGLSGRLDSNQAAELETSFLETVAGANKILLDFKGLEFISSAGLRVILMTAKRTKQAGGHLALFGLNANILKVFRVSGFLKILQVFDTREQALEFVNAPE